MRFVSDSQRVARARTDLRSVVYEVWAILWATLFEATDIGEFANPLGSVFEREFCVMLLGCTVVGMSEDLLGDLRRNSCPSKIGPQRFFGMMRTFGEEFGETC